MRDWGVSGRYLQSSDWEQRVAQSSRFTPGKDDMRAEFQEVGTSSLPSERWKSFRGLRYPTCSQHSHNKCFYKRAHRFNVSVWAWACSHITFGPKKSTAGHLSHRHYYKHNYHQLHNSLSDHTCTELLRGFLVYSLFYNITDVSSL